MLGTKAIPLLWILIKVELTTSKQFNGYNQSTMTTKQVLGNIFENYDKNTLPPSPNPRAISVSIRIKDIFDISEHGSCFDVRYYFRLKWIDERFKFTPFIEKNTTVEGIQLPFDLMVEKGR